MAPVALVIDDTPANLKLAQYLLGQAGFDVRTALGADEARAIVADTIPDIVLMDMQMPGVDGFTLTTQFKGEPRLAHVPIVAMTAYAMTGDEERTRQAGCDGYLAKPLDPATFVAAVRRYLRT
jgi:CheY-like chemotaxis protein